MVLSVKTTGTAGTWMVVDETVHTYPVSVVNKIYDNADSFTFLIERAPTYDNSVYTTEFNNIINGSVNRSGLDGVYDYSLLTIPSLSFVLDNRAEFNTEFDVLYYHSNNEVYKGINTEADLANFEKIEDISSIEPEESNIAFAEVSQMSLHASQECYNKIILDIVNNFSDCPECFKTLQGQAELGIRDSVFSLLEAAKLVSGLTISEVNIVTAMNDENKILINAYASALGENGGICKEV